MEDSLRVVEANKSCSTDEALALHVRLHVLHRKAAYIREQREADLAQATATTSSTMSLPGLLYLKSLRRQVQELASSFPQQLHQKGELNR